MVFTYSLRKNNDFKNVYNNGISKANKYFVVYLLENNCDYNRIGVSVSKKVGNSVVRHRIKRLLKESYRLHENLFNSGLSIVIIARKGAEELDYKSTESSIIHLFKLHKLIST